MLIGFYPFGSDGGLDSPAFVAMYVPRCSDA